MGEPLSVGSGNRGAEAIKAAGGEKRVQAWLAPMKLSLPAPKPEETPELKAEREAYVKLEGNVLSLLGEYEKAAKSPEAAKKLQELKQQLANAKALCAKNPPLYKEAIATLEKVKREDVIAKVINDRAEDRRKKFAALKAYPACSGLMASIRDKQKELAKAYAVDEAVIRTLDGAKSQAEKDFKALDVEFDGASRVETGYDEVLKTYEAKFKALEPALREVEKKFVDALKAVPKKAPKGKTLPLPDLLKKDVDEAQKAVDAQKAAMQARKDFEAAFVEWQRLYNAIPLALTRLEATGDDVSKLKQRHTAAPNLAPPADKGKEKKEEKERKEEKEALTIDKIKSETATLKTLAEDIDKRADEVAKAAKALTQDIIKRYTEVETTIKQCQKSKGKGVEDAFFKRLETERVALKPLIETTNNDTAQAYILDELTRIKKAAQSMSKDGASVANHGEMTKKLAELKTLINDATVKECCKTTQEKMVTDFKALEKAFEAGGPDDADVVKKYKSLVNLASNTKRDATEIQAKRQIVTNDLALTQYLLEQKIPLIKAAAQKQPGKASPLPVSMGFDPEHLRKRLASIVANHPSEELAVCDEILKGLRAFRLELNEPDFKTAIADTRQRADKAKKTAIQKEQFEKALKDFEKGPYAELQGNIVVRGLQKLHIKKGDTRVQMMTTLFEQAKKTGKSEDYDTATRQLEQAQKLANQIKESPEGSKPPAKGDFTKLEQTWVNSVGILQRSIEDLIKEIDKAAVAIAANDESPKNFKDDAKQVVDAFKDFSAQFEPSAFTFAFQGLEDDDPLQKKAAKESALQIMRKYRGVLGDPLLIKLKENPFKGVNIKQIFITLDNIDLLVQTA
jgi:hypothetical protein